MNTHEKIFFSPQFLCLLCGALQVLRTQSGHRLMLKADQYIHKLPLSEI